MDGHSTHYKPDVTRMARGNDVITLCLPPHTTADSHPLDVGVNLGGGIGGFRELFWWMSLLV